jgi:hypothetical protein
MTENEMQASSLMRSSAFMKRVDRDALLNALPNIHCP